MKVAVTATEPSLDATVDPRFGRCPYFVIVDIENMTIDAAQNESDTLLAAAGIKSAQALAEKGVQAVLTGNCGPNAYQTLSAAAIAVITGCQGTVREAVEQFKAGRIPESGGPNVASHFGASPAPSPSPEETLPPAGGTGSGTGFGMGADMGRGMGRGRGAGMGRGGGGGMGRGRGGGMGRGGGRQGWGFSRGMAAAGPDPGAQDPASPSTPSADLSPNPVDVQALNQQADALAAQLHEIQEQLARMKKEE